MLSDSYHVYCRNSVLITMIKFSKKPALVNLDCIVLSIQTDAPFKSTPDSLGYHIMGSGQPILAECNCKRGPNDNSQQFLASASLIQRHSLASHFPDGALTDKKLQHLASSLPSKKQPEMYIYLKLGINFCTSIKHIHKNVFSVAY